MKKFLLALMLLVFVVSAAYAESPLDNLKTTWEQSIERATQANRENAAWSPVWTRMQRTSFGSSASATNLPNGYDPNGEIVPFMKIAAQNSGGRIRYEIMGYSALGVPIPVAIVGFPAAPKNPGDVGNRIKIRWQCSIHGNENDGSEASLIFLREVAQGKWDELLKDVVLLVSPTANPDGKNAQTRGFTDGEDPNRCWSSARNPEIRAALKLYREWDPHIYIDHHNIGAGGILRHRHIVTFSNGKWANTDEESNRENTSFAEGLFGDGIGKYRNDNSHYKSFLREFIDDYSRGNTKGNPVYSLSDSLTSSSTSSYSPDRNKDLSLVSMPYMEALTAGQVTRDGVTRWEVIAMPHNSSDSLRSTAVVPASKNRFSILMEIVTYHHTWLKVWAMHASVISAIDLSSQRKEDLFAFFNRKDGEYINLNNNSPEYHRTTYLGNVDYRNSGNAAGGNESIPFRKSQPMKGYDHGWGPEVFKLDGHALSNASTVQRWIDYTHYPRVLLGNLPQYPVPMGAFYILDPRATTAANVLIRQGIEVFRLNEDVVLPYGSTYKMYGLDAAGNPTENWGITKNRTAYVSVYSTKLPRPRADIRNNFSVEANLVSLNYQSTAAGQPWVPLTDAQMPTVADAPELGGGEWFEVPAGYVAKAGHYVIPTTQKWARYASFQLEPRSNCGLLFWAHFDDAVGGDGRYAPANFNLDLVKTLDYTAIPASALERLQLAEEMPNYANPPYPGQLASLTDDGVTAETTQDGVGNVTVTITQSLANIGLHDGMWLTFFFYNEDGGYFDILAQIFEKEPGVYYANFTYMDLKEAAELQETELSPGSLYAVHFSNDKGDIKGYATFTKGALLLDNPVIKATPSAEVIKLNGNKNTLIITVKEIHAGGEISTLVVNFSIDNNAAATYVVGPYKVYVDTKGNTQIRECYIVK